MAQNKIESQIREKLNAREIQPSAPAWDRLDAMLSIAEVKKTKHSFFSFKYIGIAASVAVFATVGLFLFNQNGTKSNPQNAVVGTETKNDTVVNKIKNDKLPIVESYKQNEAVVTLNVQPTSENQQLTNNNKGVSIIRQEKNNQKTNSNKNQIIKGKTIEYQNLSSVAVKDVPKVIQQNEIVIVKQTQSDKALIADINKTTLQTAKTKSTIKVNAQSLLSQVDDEVELSFREKVFTKVNKNYQEVKVAFVNRNQE